MDDNRLIEEYLKTKNEIYLKKLFENNIRVLYAFVNLRVNNKADVDEVIQETHIRVWKKINKFDLTKKYKNWLLTIANNIIIDRWRVKKEESVLSEDMVVDERTQLDDLMDIDIELNKLSVIMGKLSDEQKLAITMYYLDEFSFKEISEILNISINTIKSRTLRAVKYIKEQLHQN